MKERHICILCGMNHFVKKKNTLREKIEIAIMRAQFVNPDATFLDVNKVLVKEFGVAVTNDSIQKVKEKLEGSLDKLR